MCVPVLYVCIQARVYGGQRLCTLLFFDLARIYLGGDGEGEAHYGPHGLQRTTWASLFSHSTVWVLGTELRS